MTKNKDTPNYLSKPVQVAKASATVAAMAAAAIGAHSALKSAASVAREAQLAKIGIGVQVRPEEFHVPGFTEVVLNEEVGRGK
jgi:hypothetical protein